MPETLIPGPAGHCFDRSLLNQPSEKNHMRIGNFSAWMHKKWLKHVLVITFIKLLHLTCEKTFQFHFHTSVIVKST